MVNLWRKLRGAGVPEADAIKDALDVWDNACRIVGADVRERGEAATGAQHTETADVAEAPKSVRSGGDADTHDARLKVVTAYDAVDKIEASIDAAREQGRPNTCFERCQPRWRLGGCK